MAKDELREKYALMLYTEALNGIGRIQYLIANNHDLNVDQRRRLSGEAMRLQDAIDSATKKFSITNTKQTTEGK